jgi:ADP-heptose:LPS heptosyltransferase/O-antigen ligase
VPVTPLSLSAWAAGLFVSATLFSHTVALRLLLLLLCTALVVAAIIKDRASLRLLPPLWLAFALWAAWAWLSLAWSVEPERTLKELRNEIVYTALAFWACYVAAQARDAARAIAPVLAAAAVTACAIALYHFPQGTEPYHRGLHGGPGNLSSALLTLMPCALLGAWYARRTGRVPVLVSSLALAVLFVVAAYTALNRTIWFGFAVQLLLVGAVLVWRRRAGVVSARVKVIGALLAVGVIGGAAFVSAHIYAEREPNGAAAGKLSEDPRLKLWPQVMERIQERPLTGFGFGRGALRQMLNAEFNDPLLWHAHNLFLDMVVQMGVLGLLLLLVLLGATVREGWRMARSSDDLAAACGLAVLAIAAGMVIRNVTDTLWVRQNALLYWGVLGILFAWSQRPPARAPDGGMRILVIRRDNIGDLVCTTPLFAALRARYPRAHIAALVNSYNAAVLDGNRDLDAVHVYTKLKHRRPGQSRLGILFWRLRMLARLRREAFDYVVLAKAGFDRQGLSLARQLRRRHVVGFLQAGETAHRDITLPLAGPPRSDLHEVEVMKLLAEKLDARDAPGRLRIYPDPARVQAWGARHPALTKGAWIAAHIGAREPRRRWPIARWADLVEQLTAAPGMRVLLLWAPGPADDPRHPGDDDKAAAILGQIKNRDCVVAAPTSELPDLIAALALCDAFIGADGGAMHLAAALGLPSVALFDNNEDNKRRWHPWQVPHELVCASMREVADISVEEVALAWRRLAAKALPAPAAPPAPPCSPA